jgi:hypothetical protein
MQLCWNDQPSIALVYSNTPHCLNKIWTSNFTILYKNIYMSSARRPTTTDSLNCLRVFQRMIGSFSSFVLLRDNVSFFLCHDVNYQFRGAFFSNKRVNFENSPWKRAYQDLNHSTDWWLISINSDRKGKDIRADSSDSTLKQIRLLGIRLLSPVNKGDRLTKAYGFQNKNVEHLPLYSPSTSQVADCMQ